MGGQKGGDSSKREAGLARKAETAARKAAVEDAKREAIEAENWQKGAKSNAKKEAEAAKKLEQARKKAERDLLIAQEDANTPGRAQPRNSKTAVKKTRGLDLSQLDSTSTEPPSLAALNASGIDNALDALSLTGSPDTKIDKHPERRFPAAYAKFEERRLREMEGDGSGQGLRLNQKKERIKKEFERSPDNPFNQVNAAYNTTKDEIAEIRERERSKIELRLGGRS